MHAAAAAAAIILTSVRLALAATVKLPDPTIQLVNNCAIAVQPYFNGTNPGGLPSPGLLQPGASASYSVAQNFVGTVYGIESGSTNSFYIEAGFSLQNNYYWLVNDPVLLAPPCGRVELMAKAKLRGCQPRAPNREPTRALRPRKSLGLSRRESNSPRDLGPPSTDAHTVLQNPLYQNPPSGFCGSTLCADFYCNNYFSSPPTIPTTPSSSPPQPPLYECTGQGTGYQVV
jgi:hypothetical protein